MRHPTKLTEDVNPEQRAAIEHGAGPLLVVAGAGSGKTRVITRRVAHLVTEGVPPRNLVALTFTNKAAREMRDRVAQFVTAPDLWVCTFHSFCARVLRRFANRLGYTREFTIYDTEDQTRLIKAVLKDLQLDDLRPGEVSQTASRRKNSMKRTELPGWRAERMTKATTEYDRRLKESNAMDFDDLLVNTGRLLEDPGVLEVLQDRCRWILVDEYQDTNAIQYKLLNALAQPERNVCATGDPDQSIYRWRGATLRNILDFERDFPGAAVITLDRNYRSTKTILNVANAVISHNKDRFEKDLRTENEVGGPALEIRCSSEADEGRVIVRQIGRWIDAGRGARELAIFYRVNAQSRTLEKSLREAGLPYRIVGSVEFYKRKEVKDVLAYVRLTRNPQDLVGFRRIFNVPARALGAKTEARVLFESAEAGLSPRDFMRDRDRLRAFPGRARKPLFELADLLDRLEAMPTDDPALFVERVVDEVKYLDYLGRGTAGAEIDRIENVEELISAASEFSEREPEAGIDGFLEEHALVSDQDTYDGQVECVTLMTVHAAKGLEFPCVLLTGLEEGLFPHSLSLDTPDEIEEERRLFYVAVTRAEEELVLTHAQSRFRQGAPMNAAPSRFLDEIPDEHLEVEDRTGFRHSDPATEYRSRSGDGGDWGVSESADSTSTEYDLDDVPVFQRDGPQAEPRFQVGDRVSHEHFGRGHIVAVAKRGAATRITIDFLNSGRRELSLTYARLKKLG
ncbi:MAG: UvrD-helicase domain-containing protein [Planctomycetota bacterium]